MFRKKSIQASMRWFLNPVLEGWVVRFSRNGTTDELFEGIRDEPRVILAILDQAGFVIFAIWMAKEKIYWSEKILLLA